MEVSKVVINKDLIKKETRYHADNYHFGALEMWYFISLQWMLRISHEFKVSNVQVTKQHFYNIC